MAQFAAVILIRRRFVLGPGRESGVTRQERGAFLPTLPPCRMCRAIEWLWQSDCHGSSPSWCAAWSLPRHGRWHRWPGHSHAAGGQPCFGEQRIDITKDPATARLRSARLITTAWHDRRRALAAGVEDGPPHRRRFDSDDSGCKGIMAWVRTISHQTVPPTSAANAPGTRTIRARPAGQLTSDSIGRFAWMTRPKWLFITVMRVLSLAIGESTLIAPRSGHRITSAGLAQLVRFRLSRNPMFLRRSEPLPVGRR
jgi:hypothetical protein